MTKFGLPFFLFALVAVLAACASTASLGSLLVTNLDPLAPPELATLQLTPPEGWTLAENGSGITDGDYLISVTTLSISQENADAILQSVDGRAYGDVVVERQSPSRLVAWLTVDDTLTTVQMQSRTDALFTQAHDDLLVQVANSVQLAP